MAQGALHTQTPDGDRTDYLYRISLKAYIRNEAGEVLVVKEAGRTAWDLPGGGMDHGETVQAAFARELREEIGYDGEFSYRPIAVDDAHILHHLDAYQLRIIFEVTTSHDTFMVGDDCDEISLISPDAFKDSPHVAEQNIYRYSLQLANGANDY